MAFSIILPCIVFVFFCMIKHVCSFLLFMKSCDSCPFPYVVLSLDSTAQWLSSSQFHGQQKNYLHPLELLSSHASVYISDYLLKRSYLALRSDALNRQGFVNSNWLFNHTPADEDKLHDGDG